MEKTKRILIIGGPGSGKTSVLATIEENGYYVHHEISREVTAKAQEQGIEQLFLSDPFAFSNQLLEGRIQQFKNIQEGINFYDRGIPDVPAYHVFTGDEIPDHFIQACKDYKYDQVFFLPPWEQIYESDNERYESYEQAVVLGDILLNFYKKLGYAPISVPKLDINSRYLFIKEHL
ncbi:putative ATPase [Nonlabens dokdonensis]|jgi:predicted ATPase|uniref:ATPase n=2 Tax=Nonlabens dokdonensis TaxID=328515 RepID=L7WD06_NONDD|nr:ATP-binding protein [Nonlabens dokdonensis]AGC77974.1 ATPase [Nonlabens dokdonensis DSW-6]PZX37045.1 putative ATPase [Nonlabens dokdonensis]